ncbi:hypothetical protein GALMADRAFT_254864 [Galerina marginata CBS 339.88]|uniref:C2H2-type domain-containing protein n=1 Tax=Galerina marginata (strain CBS 339.88) TaxID=685588 RepID=A0A067SKB9_GALM3|nr:hypothetical protein GALMADRAFT_254864 [Galerina marginata CBS 339.88]
MSVKHFCLSCSRTFKTIPGVKSHARAKQHRPNPFYCGTCSLSFVSLTTLEAHVNSPDHLGASVGAIFLDGRDIASKAEIDIIEFYCELCDLIFVDVSSLNHHLSDIRKHNWCFLCSSDFRRAKSLRQHKRSLAHRVRSLKCPLCEALFKSPSGVASHIESGCHGYTRHDVTAAIHCMEVVPNISIKRVTGPPSNTTLLASVATQSSFNGKTYGCSLCRKKFRTLQGLNGHLNSPAHDEAEFRCPKCKTKFKLISGFIQHLESRSCGLAKTTEIKHYFEDLTGQFSRLLKM